jgi:hypothetical protein
MAIKASNYRNWCTENISPQSWTRIVLKCHALVKDRGLTLNQMEENGVDVDLDGELFAGLNAALSELYEMTVDEELISKY